MGFETTYDDIMKAWGTRTTYEHGILFKHATIGRPTLQRLNDGPLGNLILLNVRIDEDGPLCHLPNDILKLQLINTPTTIDLKELTCKKIKVLQLVLKNTDDVVNLPSLNDIKGLEKVVLEIKEPPTNTEEFFKGVDLNRKPFTITLNGTFITANNGLTLDCNGSEKQIEAASRYVVGLSIDSIKDTL